MDMESMAALMQMMMGGNNNSDSDSATDDEDAENEQESSGDFSDMFNNINFDMLAKMGELFSRMNEPDRNAELLMALKPHLRDENQHKVDSAMKMSRMMAMIPFIKESGMLNDLF